MKLVEISRITSVNPEKVCAVFQNDNKCFVITVDCISTGMIGYLSDFNYHDTKRMLEGS